MAALRAGGLQISLQCCMCVLGLVHSASSKELLAAFSGSVTGNITVTQANSSAPAIIAVNLHGLTASYGPFGWHVHVLPVTSGGCGATGGHYNPKAMPDEGELSKKFSDLPAQGSITASYFDKKMTLYGASSVAGRSIVLHKNSQNGNARYVCATIADPDSGQVTLVAAFKRAGRLIGTVALSQGYEDGPTLISTSLHGMEFGPNPWHLHTNPVSGSDAQGAQTKGVCASAGGHFNPAQRPALGELSARHGDIMSNGTAGGLQSAVNTSVDYEVQLFGTSSVVGRSIVIHMNGTYQNARWICATLVNIKDQVTAPTAPDAVTTPEKLDPAGTSEFVDVTFSLDITQVPSSSKAQEFFKIDLRRELAGALKVNFERIKVVSIKAASIVVRFQILPDSAAASRAAYLGTEPTPVEAVSALSAMEKDKTGAGAQLFSNSAASPYFSSSYVAGTLTKVARAPLEDTSDSHSALVAFVILLAVSAVIVGVCVFLVKGPYKDKFAPYHDQFTATVKARRSPVMRQSVLIKATHSRHSSVLCVARRWLALMKWRVCPRVSQARGSKWQNSIQQQMKTLSSKASLLRIPVIGSIARGDQRLNCSVRGSTKLRTEQFSR